MRTLAPQWPLQEESITAFTRLRPLLATKTVRGLLDVTTSPAGPSPFWLIRTKTASFFCAAGARFFLTATISLWVTTALFVLASAGKTAVALETSARTTTAATRKRRNIHQGYGAALV